LVIGHGGSLTVLTISGKIKLNETPRGVNWHKRPALMSSKQEKTMIAKRINGKWEFRGTDRELQDYKTALLQKIEKDYTKPMFLHPDWMQFLALQKQLIGDLASEAKKLVETTQAFLDLQDLIKRTTK
jgi:hypothetical protein